MLSLRRLIRAGAATVFLVATVTTGALAATPAASASGFTWSIIPAPGNGSLSGVACVTASDCWGVGVAVSGTSEQTFAEHWNGSAWSIVTTPDTSSPSNDLRAVACIGSSDCWAVGVAVSGTSEQTLAEHWNGSAWSIVTTPDTSSSSNDLLGVACVTLSDCWAVGISRAGLASQTLAEHWNGSAWSIVTTPDTSSPSNYFEGVACISSSDCWAVGASRAGLPTQNLAEHWNGSTWSIVTTPDASSGLGDNLSGLTCISASDCWAVGFADTAANGNPATLAEHWSGSAWTIVTTRNRNPSEQNYLTGIACIGSSDCWAVGYSVVSNPSPPSIQRTLAEHWNGSAWSIAATSNTPETNSLGGVACVSTSDCWAVGSSTSKTLIEHGPVGLARVKKPDAPSAVVATPGVGSISVSWTAPASDGGSPILYYVVSATYGGKKFCTTPGPTATGPTACTVMGLRGGRNYTLRVRAFNAIGESPTATATVFLPKT
jgi:Fibronectin type III domain